MERCIAWSADARSYFFTTKTGFVFIADFMCKELMLIIEVDGYTHEWEEQWKVDQQRQKKLETVGFSIIRFTDEEVLKDIRNVERVIESWVVNHPPSPGSRTLSKGELFKEVFPINKV